MTSSLDFDPNRTKAKIIFLFLNNKKKYLFLQHHEYVTRQNATYDKHTLAEPFSHICIQVISHECPMVPRAVEGYPLPRSNGCKVEEGKMDTHRFFGTRIFELRYGTLFIEFNVSGKKMGFLYDVFYKNS